jgi:hypothetical protein
MNWAGQVPAAFGGNPWRAARHANPPSLAHLRIPLQPVTQSARTAATPGSENTVNFSRRLCFKIQGMIMLCCQRLVTPTFQCLPTLNAFFTSPILIPWKFDILLFWTLGMYTFWCFYWHIDPFIARQRLGKHVPTNNRTSIARQGRGKYARYSWERCFRCGTCDSYVMQQ